MKRKPLSLYVHIPFCVRKCLYCDFLSGPAGGKEKQEYVDLLCREIDIWGQQLRKEYRLETIFLGGGTPSCLLPEQLKQIGAVIHENFCCSEEMEFTTEANPGTISLQHIKAWKQMGINRISLGLQSAQDAELSKLGRIHSYQEFVDTYRQLKKEGFDNINIDLMSDIPGQTIESYADTLKKVIALNPQHISAYSLIVEPGTVFFEMEEQGLLKHQDEETERKLYEMTETILKRHGFKKYEISNYALPARECQHNCVYWQGGEYLGVGLGAASYLNKYRFANQGTVEAYQRYIESAEAVVNGIQKIEEREVLSWTGWDFAELSYISVREQMEEFMFLGLRMTNGISKKEFYRRFQTDISEIYGEILVALYEKDLLAEDKMQDRIYLTRKGIDLSNMVLAEFLLEE